MVLQEQIEEICLRYDIMDLYVFGSREIAGYRNRMVHFYHEIGQEELYQLCTRNMEDIEVLLETLTGWLRDHPEKMDQKM